MVQAEKILLEDGAVAPFYQTGRSYLHLYSERTTGRWI
ncbi:hypothetical protein IKQ_05315 [Bacillus cereus VDM053]|nr:hypothetical protein IKQ_05315 [Bacillus cereus VDM053]